MILLNIITALLFADPNLSGTVAPPLLFSEGNSPDGVHACGMKEACDKGLNDFSRLLSETNPGSNGGSQ